MYLVYDVLHYLLLICDIDTLVNMIVNKDIYNYCNQQFIRHKLTYHHLPIIEVNDYWLKYYKEILYANNIAKQIIVMNQMSNNYVYRKIIDIDFKRKKVPKLLSDALHQQLMTFDITLCELACENICLTLKNNIYYLKYQITHYNTGDVYFTLKETINVEKLQFILTTILYDSYGRNHYYTFSSHFFNDITIGDDQQDNYVVMRKKIEINDSYNTCQYYG